MYRPHLVHVSLRIALLFASSVLWADPTATVQPAGGGAPLVFDTIQEAVDAALPGDTIVLSRDTFTGPGNRDILIDKNLILRGEGKRDETVIDCEGQGRAFHVVGPNVDETTLFTCFTVTGGSATGGIAQGGAMLVEDASPRLFQVAMRNNSVAGQGGAYAHNGGLVDLTRCLVKGNTATSAGGVFITLTDGLINDCDISGNTADVVGGGVAISGTGPNGPLILDTEIRNNQAGLQGGGIYVELVQRATVERCVIVGNSSGGQGGGVAMIGDLFLSVFDVVLVKNSILARNTAATNGGGMSLAFLGGVFQNVTLVDNVALGSGGGVDALLSDGYFFTNSIVWGNRSSDPDLLDQQVRAASFGLPLVDYSNVEGLTPFLGNISEDPQFQNQPGGNYHIMYSSPCRDAGDPVFVPQPGELDVDEQNRIFGGRIDIGADEYAFDEVFLLQSPASRKP